MPYRCVKCTDEHEPGKCQLKPKDANNTIQEDDINTEQPATNSIPKCVNCKSDGHPASYRNCPMYKKVKQRAEERERIRRELHQQTIDNNGQSSSNRTTSKAITVTDKNFLNLPIPRFHSPTKESNIITASQSYSQKLKTTISEANGSKNAMSFIDKECADLFGTDLMSIITEVQNFIPAYRQQQTNQEKQMYLIKCILRLVNTP